MKAVINKPKKKAVKRDRMTRTTKAVPKGKKARPIFLYAIWKPAYQEDTILIENLDRPMTQDEWRKVLSEATDSWKKLAETSSLYLNDEAIEKIKTGPKAWLHEDDGYYIIDPAIIDEAPKGDLMRSLDLE